MFSTNNTNRNHQRSISQTNENRNRNLTGLSYDNNVNSTSFELLNDPLFDNKQQRSSRFSKGSDVTPTGINITSGQNQHSSIRSLSAKGDPYSLSTNYENHKKNSKTKYESEEDLLSGLFFIFFLFNFLSKCINVFICIVVFIDLPNYSSRNQKSLNINNDLQEHQNRPNNYETISLMNYRGDNSSLLNYSYKDNCSLTSSIFDTKSFGGTLTNSDQKQQILENYLILDRLNKKQQRKHELKIKRRELQQQQLNELKQKQIEMQEQIKLENQLLIERHQKQQQLQLLQQQQKASSIQNLPQAKMSRSFLDVNNNNYNSNSNLNLKNLVSNANISNLSLNNSYDYIGMNASVNNINNLHPVYINNNNNRNISTLSLNNPTNYSDNILPQLNYAYQNNNNSVNNNSYNSTLQHQQQQQFGRLKIKSSLPQSPAYLQHANSFTQLQLKQKQQQHHLQNEFENNLFMVSPTSSSVMSISEKVPSPVFTKTAGSTRHLNVSIIKFKCIIYLLKYYSSTFKLLCWF
jgi:hypothetical protein